MSRDNRTPTPGKNAWLARPRSYENETVSVNRGPADTPHGYTRDVYLSQVINEPGKGGTNPPRREIVTRLHSDDAITLGLHLVENGVHAEQRNEDEGQGGEREPYFEHPQGDPDRRMPEDFARTNLRLLAAVLARVQRWQDTHPDVADYRVTGVLEEGRKISSYLRYLADNTTPDLDAARAELARSGLFDQTDTSRYRAMGDEEFAQALRASAKPIGEIGEAGALTGHGPTDRHEGKAPRVTATGRYFVTATSSVPVTVVSVDADSIDLTVTGDTAEEYPDGITAPRSEAGTWLALDNPSDWLDTDD